MISTMENATDAGHTMELDEEEGEFIDIPIRAETGEETDQVIGIPVDELPSIDTVLGILTQEEAALHRWITVSVEYYRQEKFAEFEALMNIGVGPEVENRYSDDKKGLLQMLNLFASYKILQEGADQGFGISTSHARDRRARKPSGERLAEAVELLSRADKLDDRESATWVNKGILSLVQGKLDTSFQNFDRALLNDPKNLFAKLGKGFALYKKRQFAAARDQYKRIIREHPGCNASVRTNLGLCYYQLGIESRAIECFERAIELDEEEPNAHVALAIIELARSQRGAFDPELMKRGMKRLRRVYEVGTNNGVVLNHLAHHFFKKESGNRDYSNVESLALKAYKNTHLPEIKAEAAYILGRNYHEQGDMENATEFYERSLKDWPKFVLAQFSKAQMLLAKSASGNGSKRDSDNARNEALQLFEKILRNPDHKDDRDTMMCTAWIYIRTNRRRQAMNLLKRITSKNPGDVDAWLEQCRVLQRESLPTRKQKREAIRAYTKAAGGYSSIPAFIFTNVGELKFSLGDISGALEVFREGLELESKGDGSISEEDLVSLKFNFARVLEETGEFDEAETIYRDISNRLKNYTEPLLRLGVMAQRQGRISKAEEFFLQATSTKTDPDSAWCYLGSLSSLNNNPKRAKEYFSRVMKGDRHRFDAYSKLCLANLAFDAIEGKKAVKPAEFREGVDYAKKWYIKVLERDNTNVFAAGGLANGLAADGYFPEAMQILESLRERNDVSNPCIWISLGHIAMENERFDIAASLYQQSLKQFERGEDIDLLICLASALTCSEKFSDAHSVILRAMKIDPSDLRLRYNFGMLLLKQGGYYCDRREEKRTLQGMVRAVSGFEDAKSIFEWLSQTKSMRSETHGTAEATTGHMNEGEKNDRTRSSLFLQGPRPPMGNPTELNKKFYVSIMSAIESARKSASVSSTATDNMTPSKEVVVNQKENSNGMRPMEARAPRSDTFRHANAALQLVERAKVYINKSEKFLVMEHHHEKEKELALMRLREQKKKLEDDQREADRLKNLELERIRADEERRAQETAARSRRIAAELQEQSERKQREKEKRSKSGKGKSGKKAKKTSELDDFMVDDREAHADTAEFENQFENDSIDSDDENDRDFDPKAAKKRRHMRMEEPDDLSEESELSAEDSSDNEAGDEVSRKRTSRVTVKKKKKIKRSSEKLKLIEKNGENPDATTDLEEPTADLKPVKGGKKDTKDAEKGLSASKRVLDSDDEMEF